MAEKGREKRVSTLNKNSIELEIELSKISETPLSKMDKIINKKREIIDSERNSTTSGGSLLNFFPRYRGMLLALVSSLMFSLTALIVKFLKSYHPFTIALWRFQGAFLPSIVLLIYKESKYRRRNKARANNNPRENSDKESESSGGSKSDVIVESVIDRIYPWTDRKKFKMFLLVMLRSILSCNALLLHFFSLKYLEMGDALVISSSTPVFVTLFAHYFLGEKCGLVPIFSAIMTVLGVIVIAKPPHIFGYEEFDEKTIIGTGLALGCMLIATVSYLVLRYIRKVHHVATNLAFGGWGTLENFILALVFGVLSWPNCYKDWLAAFTLASLTFVGQMAIIIAMKCEQAGPVSLVRTCDVIFAFFWQICVLDCWPEIYSWIGCSIVLFSLIVTAMRKWVESLHEDDINRKRFFFILL